MKGLIISDSLMRGCPKQAICDLKNNQGLSELDLLCFPGYTIGQIIGGDGEIHSLMQKNTYDQVFLICGSNDLNNNTDDCPVLKFKSIAKELNDLLHSVSSLYPNTKFHMGPIPKRNVCKVSNMIHAFPNYGSKKWVEITNSAICLLYENFNVCACHSTQVTFVISPSHDFWNPLLSPDGLHLSQAGKCKMIQFFLKAESHFSASAEDFPPLPQSSSKFSFKPQVEVPKMAQKKKPNNNLFIHQCCMNQDLSFRGPTQKSTSKSVKVSVASSKYIKVRSNKPKRPKNPNPWLFDFANADDCYSEPNHLPQAKPKQKKLTKKIGNYEQQRREKSLKEQKRTKKPWYEYDHPEVQTRKSRESMKQNSRRDPSVSLRRNKVNIECPETSNEQEVKERHCLLLSRLSSKISDLKNSRRPSRNNFISLKLNGKNKKSGKKGSPIKTSRLSYEKQENIMNKIKEFLNPLNEELSNTSRETEEKISLTYNTKSGCQISLEKSNGEIETFLDFMKENSNDVNGLSSKNFDSSDTSLLGGHKKKSKSQEREAKRRKRTAKLNNLSEDDLIQEKADERARKKDYYEKNKSDILSSRQTHYETNKSEIVSFYPVEVSARGQVTKENRSRLKSFLLKCCSNPRAISKKVITVASKAAILSSYSIFCARKEPTWEDPSPMVVR